MSAWGTTDMTEALPEATEVQTSGDNPEQPTKTPQEHGWVQKQGYDYAQYNKTNKEIADGLVAGEETGEETTTPAAEEEFGAVGGLRPGEWASNAAVYEFPHGEFGDVGPPMEALEKQLFGSNLHVKSGIDFKK